MRYLHINLSIWNISGFRPYMMRNIEISGYKQPSAVQQHVIPMILQRRECLVAAPTGSGKTASYILPILHLLQKPKKEGVRTLVIAPTAVLVRQITRDFERLSRGKPWGIINLDQSMKRMKEKFSKSKKIDIVVATPKKLLTLTTSMDNGGESSGIDLHQVKFLILDEADQLLGQGFDQFVFYLILIIIYNHNIFIYYFYYID